MSPGLELTVAGEASSVQMIECHQNLFGVLLEHGLFELFGLIEDILNRARHVPSSRLVRGAQALSDHLLGEYVQDIVCEFCAQVLDQIRVRQSCSRNFNVLLD